MFARIKHSLKLVYMAPLLCFGLAYLLMQTEPLQQLAWRTLDWRTSLRALYQPPADPRIAVVLFEDDTETNLVPWPPDRAYHGVLAQLVSMAGAKVLTLDIILDANREGEGDESMCAAIEEAGNAGMRVVTGAVTNQDALENEPSQLGLTAPLTQVEGDWGQVYGEDHALLPFPALRDAAYFGYVDAPRGSDGIIREIPLVVRVGAKVYPSLSLQTLMAYYNVKPEQVRVKLGEAIYLPTDDGGRRIPITERGMYFMNFRYDHDDVRPDFPTRTYREVVVKLNAHYVEKTPYAPTPPDYHGKIVLVGQTVTGRADAGPTPRSAYSPLVLMHANVVNNVLAQDYAHRVPDWISWLLVLALAYVGVWLGLTRSISLVATLSALMVVLYLGLTLWGWIGWSLWFPWIGPLAGLVGSQFLVIAHRVWQEQKAKQEIKGMFGSYVSPALVDRLVEAGTPPKLGGVQASITAFFSDIQGFSAFSEILPPEQLVELMNEYLTACTDIITDEGGTLDKYIGDAVVAMFGAPIPLEDHAYRACAAALRIQQKTQELREKWRGEGDKWPTVVHGMQTRIGLNSGIGVVGNMGSRTRFNYTMMGDDVNLGARMESGAKHWGVYAMTTESTREACVKYGGDRIVFRSLGRIVVKGRAGAVPIYEIVGWREHMAEATLACLRHFTVGLECYFQRDWISAVAAFEQSALLEPLQPNALDGVKTNPSQVFLRIIAEMREKPPPEDWNGVYVMEEK